LSCMRHRMGKIGVKQFLLYRWVTALFMVIALFSPAEASAAPAAVTLTSPTDTLSEATTPVAVEFVWEANADATYYKVKITDDSGSTTYLNNWYSISSTNCSSGSGSCSVTPSITLDVGSYTWTVYPYGAGMGDGTSGTFALVNSTTSTPGTPDGTIDESSPTFQWSATSSGTYYKLRVTDSSGSDVHNQWYSAASAGCSNGLGECSVTPSLILVDGSYTWYTTPWTSSVGSEDSGTAFTIDTADNTPLTPTPTSPSGAITSATPTYNWTLTTNSTHYTLVVNDGSTDVVSTQYTLAELGCDTGTDCSITPSGSNLDDDSYTWTLLPYNSTDDLTGTISSSVNFSVDTTVNTPGTPTPTSPSGTINTLTPTYSWTLTDNSTHYTLVVNDGTSDVVSTQYTVAELSCDTGTDCSITPDGSTLTETDYTWTLLPYNSTDDLTGTISSTVSFTIDLDDTPVTPTPSSPTGTITTVTPTYSWTATTNSTHYTLKVTDNSSNTIVDTQYTVAELGCSVGSGTCSIETGTALTNGTTYSWSLTPYNSTDAITGTTSSSASFTVTLTELDAPTGLSPSGDITEEELPAALTFEWDAVSESTNYKVVADGNENIVSIWYTAADANCDSGTGTCSVNPSETFDTGSYSWSVTPYGSAGSGTAANATFNLTSSTSSSTEAPSGTITTSSPTYQWGATSSATYYQLRVTDSSGDNIHRQWYSTTDADCSSGTGDCSVTPSLILTDASYSWYITPWIGSAADTESSATAFTVNATINIPDTPTPTSPSGTITTTLPTYTWTSTANSSDYTLKVSQGSTTVINIQYSASDLGCEDESETCSVTPSTTLSDGVTYTWTLTPYNGTDNLTGDTSSSLEFNVALDTPGTPTPASPLTTTNTKTPTYSWAATTNSTHYTLTITDSSSTILEQQYSLSDLDCADGVGTCSITPSPTLVDGTSYSWTLLPYNSTESLTGTISSTATFTVALDSPGTPTPSSPSSSTSTTTPAYTWAATENSTHYTLTIADSSSTNIMSEQYTVTELGCSVGSGTCSITPATTLTEDATYSWTLLAYNEDGNVYGTTSSSVSFTVSTTVDTPGTPSPLLPSGTATTLTPTFSWLATEYSTHYTLSVSDSSDSTIYSTQYSVSDLGCSVGSGTCFITPSTELTTGSSYTWAISPYNSTDALTGTTSDTASFTVTLNTPVTPTPASPSSITADTDPTYSWEATNHSTHYTLKVTDSSDSSTILDTQYSVSELGCSIGSGTCSITPENATLTDGSSYSWTLIPYNNTDSLTGTISSSVSFTVDITDTTPGTPVLVAPSGTIEDTTPEYSWTSTTNSDYYILVVNHAENGIVISKWYSLSDLECSDDTGNCTVTPDTELIDGESYSWYVTPYNNADGVGGTASSTGSFAIGINSPGTPTPASPYITANSITPTYSWTATENSTHYTLEVTNSSGTLLSTQYSVSELGCSVGSGTCSISPSTELTDGMAYAWTLLPYNSTDSLTGAESSAVAFTVNVSTNVPGTPTPALPSNTATSTTPTYTWAATSYSSDYTLTVASSSGTIHSQKYNYSDLGCAIGSGTCSITPTTILNENVVYSWTLLPYNSTDDLTGTLSVAVSFTVNTTVSTPGTPTPSSPSGTISSINPTYSWTATTYSTHYTLQVNDSSGTVISQQYSVDDLGCSVGSGTCSITPATALSNTTDYTWTLLPYNSTDDITGIISNTIAFSVSKSITLTSPITNSETETTPTYTWDAISDATSYSLVVTDSSDATVVSESYTAAEANCSDGSGSCSVTPSLDLGIGSFSWSVTATPGGDTGSSSFTTVLGTLDAPTIVSPTSETTTETASPTFTWSAVESANYYTITVIGSDSVTAVSAVSVTASAAFCESGSGNCTYTPSITLAIGQGTWYILAVDSDTDRTSSTASSSFTIASTAYDPGAATPITPNGTEITSSPAFTWTSAENSTHYKLVITDSNGDEVKDYTASATSAACGSGEATCNLTFASLDNGTYGWTVQSWSSDTSSYGTKSASQSFIIASSSTTDPDDFLISPTGTIYTTTPSFIWSSVSGSTYYRLEIMHVTTGSAVFRETYTPTEVGCASTTTCLAIPNATLTTGTYVWEVIAFPSMQKQTMSFTIPEDSDITILGDSVDENIDTQTKVGVLSIFSGSVAADEIIFSISTLLDGSSFVIKNDDELWTASGFSPDYESDSILSVTISSSTGKSATFDITVNDLNDTPTAIVLSNSDVSIYADTTSAYSIGVLTATDEDTLTAYLSHTFAITGGDDEDDFTISDSSLQFVALTDLEIRTYSVEVTVTDGGGATYAQTLTINVTDKNEAPTDIISSNTTDTVSISSTSVTLTEALAVGTLSVTDINVDDTHTLSITGGRTDLFELSGTDNMDLQFVLGATLSPTCTATYDVEITATDSGGLTYAETFSIIVDVTGNEAPTAISLSSYVMPFMDRASSMSIGVLTTTDPNDACDTFTYTINSIDFIGDNQALTDYSDSFSVIDDQLYVVDSDSTVFGVFSINLTSTDKGGLSIAVTLDNISIGGFSVDEILDNDASHPTVAEMLAAASTTYNSINDALTAASSGDTVTISEYELEDLIIGKVGQQITTGNSSGTPFDKTTTDIVKQFHVDITPSMVTATMEIAAIDAMYNYMPTNVQTAAVGLFGALTQYATNDITHDSYTAGVRLRISPTVSGTTLSFDSSASYVDVLFEDSLLIPNMTLTVSELITQYNTYISPLTEATDSLILFQGKSIPTSKSVDYYFPGMISSFSIETGSIELTR
jgi:large repetitive protein